MMIDNKNKAKVLKGMTQFEKTYNLIKKPWVIVAYIALTILVYFFVDRALAAYSHQMNLRINLHILNVFTNFGKVTLYVGLFSFLALLFRYVTVHPAYEARAWYLLVCIITANLICLILKVTLGRARPDLLFLSNNFGFYWFKINSFYWSFPSGHTMTVVALAAALGVIFPRYFYIFFVLALLIVLTRVLLYYHYLSDVLTGLYLSLLVVGLLTQYITRNRYLSQAWKK